MKSAALVSSPRPQSSLLRVGLGAQASHSRLLTVPTDSQDSLAPCLPPGPPPSAQPQPCSSYPLTTQVSRKIPPASLPPCLMAIAGVLPRRSSSILPMATLILWPPLSCGPLSHGCPVATAAPFPRLPHSHNCPIGFSSVPRPPPS